MCRIAYVRSPETIGGATQNYMHYLEEANGGHGNGICGFTAGESLLQKGVKFTTEQSAKIAATHEWDNGYLFHTRIASAGSICDVNNHPFQGTLNDETFFFVHNGTWSDYRVFLDYLSSQGKISSDKMNNITDSEVMMLMVEQLGFDATHLARSGVWMLFDKDGVKFNVRSGRLEALLHYKKDGEVGTVIAIASQFPISFNKVFANGSRFEVKAIKDNSLGILANKSKSIKFLTGGFSNTSDPPRQFVNSIPQKEHQNEEKKLSKKERKALRRQEQKKITVISNPAEFSGNQIIGMIEDLLLEGDRGGATRHCLCCTEIFESMPLWQLLSHVNERHTIKPKNMFDSNCSICLGNFKFVDDKDWLVHFQQHVFFKTGRGGADMMEYVR